ncbi:MAG: hypothetical protein WA021_04705 [Minisyncoccia bacterium]
MSETFEGKPIYETDQSKEAAEIEEFKVVLNDNQQIMQDLRKEMQQLENDLKTLRSQLGANPDDKIAKARYAEVAMRLADTQQALFNDPRFIDAARNEDSHVTELNVRERDFRNKLM